MCIFFFGVKIHYNKFRYLKSKFNVLNLYVVGLLVETLMPEIMRVTVRLIQWCFDEFTVKL